MNPLILPAIDWIVSPLSFKKDGFEIKSANKVDMPLQNKQI